MRTPDAFWKVIIREGRVIVGVIPNSQRATRKRLDQYPVTVAPLKRVTGQRFPAPEYLKAEKPETFWLLPIGCEKGSVHAFLRE